MVWYSSACIQTKTLISYKFTGESEDIDEENDTKDGIKKEGGNLCKNDKDAAIAGTAPTDKKDGQCNSVKVEKDLKESQRVKDLKIAESEMVRDLKAQLKYVLNIW